MCALVFHGTIQGVYSTLTYYGMIIADKQQQLDILRVWVL